MTEPELEKQIRHLAEAEFRAWRELRDKKREFQARRGEAALEAAQGDAAARKRYQEAVASIAMLEDVITGARARREELLKQALERECAELEREAAELERQADEIARRRMKLEAELRELEGYPVHIRSAQALSSRLREDAERLRLEAKRKRAEGPPGNGYAEGCSLEELVEAMLRYPTIVPAIRDVEAWWDALSRAAAGHGGPIEAARLVWRNGRIHNDYSFVLTHSSLVKLERTWDGGTMTRGERTTRTLPDSLAALDRGPSGASAAAAPDAQAAVRVPHRSERKVHPMRLGRVGSLHAYRQGGAGPVRTVLLARKSARTAHDLSDAHQKKGLQNSHVFARGCGGGLRGRPRNFCIPLPRHGTCVATMPPAMAGPAGQHRTHKFAPRSARQTSRVTGGNK
jgi:hypothetical protein